MPPGEDIAAGVAAPLPMLAAEDVAVDVDAEAEEEAVAVGSGMGALNGAEAGAVLEAAVVLELEEAALGASTVAASETCTGKTAALARACVSFAYAGAATSRNSRRMDAVMVFMIVSRERPACGTPTSGTACS